MNYQKTYPEAILNILKDRGVEYIDIDYYAWPQIFSDTTGPCGGFGGQSMSTFTIDAYVCDGCGPTVYMCCGMYSFEDKKFEPFGYIDNWFNVEQTFKF